MKRIKSNSAGLNMKFSFFLVIASLVLLLAYVPYKEKSDNPFSERLLEEKVRENIDSLIRQMTLEEKVGMLHGNGMFTSAGVERLGIPELHYADGPLGIREELQKDSWSPAGWTTDSATFFPAGGGLSATWNPDLALKYGQAIGAEARARNKDILLAPAVNIIRTPLGGRDFEYFTEDPYLNIRIVVPYIKGVQQQDVAACIKHFAVNNQETQRGSIDVQVDERTLREIYLPVYKAAVQEANVYSVMGAYNKFRGAYLCENDYLLNKILKTEWGFNGIVISDWGAVHSTVASANNGLDIEMGSRGKYNAWYMADPLLDSVRAGKVSEKVIDEKVRRILYVINGLKIGDKNRKRGAINAPEHTRTAYDVASESVVLLKNSQDLLPLIGNKLKNVAVIGDNATRKQASGGFGAGVKTRYEVTPLQGLRNRLGDKVAISVAPGYKEKFLPRDNNRRGFGREPDNTPDSTLINEAVRMAKAADVAIIFAGSNRQVESEATDRKNMKLPFGQDELIKAVVKANPNTVVVIIGGAPFDLTEVDKATSALIWSWFNGSEGGNALADVILGNVNPSGKLPFTIPRKLEDSPAHALNAFPGDDKTVTYKEGLLVGYRWFDTKDIEPMYCFGHGLSYSTFAFSHVSTNKRTYERGDPVSVKVHVKNTGHRVGKETVQLYVSAVKSAVQRPEKELKAFRKVSVEAGKDAEVTLTFSTKDLAYFDERTNSWILEPGEYRLMIGSSSRDIKESVPIKIN